LYEIQSNYLLIEERNQSCSKRCNRSELKRVYKVKDYKYIGGSYGKCSEYSMMQEVIKNGPIVVSFEPDYLFMHYKKGIYKSVAHSWVTNGNKKPLWQKVDHSVVLVGWGYDEEKKIPYWILQNSWGPHWGENGYFKMLRGVDHLGIESICESGIPYYIDL
jgi:cathepsin C